MRMRSMTFPSAPPRMRLRARQNIVSEPCLRSSQPIHIAAAIAMPMKRPRCQPPASASRLKAAPLLYTSSMLKNDVISTTSWSENACVTAYLVSWSTTMTQAERPNHLSMRAHLARAEEVRRAASADLRMLGIGSDVRAVVPAALALGEGARTHAELHPRDHRLRGR